MAKIEVGQFSNLLRRWLSLSGVVEVAGELAPEISPVFVLESERPEWAFLKSEKLISGVTTVTGAPALDSTTRFRNPSGSGVLMVVDKFWISAGSTSVFNVFLNALDANLATLFPLIPVARDPRWPLVPSSIIASGDNVAGVGSNIASGWCGDRISEIDCPFILTPGHSVDFNTEQDATTHRVTCIWKERRLGELEVA